VDNSGFNEELLAAHEDTSISCKENAAQAIISLPAFFWL
jgi:hypothetical protein